MQPVALFFAINGVGLGHLTRCLSIARNLQGISPVFVTTCRRAHVLGAFGIPFHYVPTLGELKSASLVAGGTTYQQLLYSTMRTLYETYRPAALITDGLVPYPGLVRAWQEFPGAGRISIRRAYKLDGEREVRVVQRDSEYHRIIIPHAKDEFEIPLPHGVPADHVGPVSVLDRDEALSRDAAREALGLPMDKTVLLMQLGAGELGRGKDIERYLLEGLADTDVHIVLTSYDPGADAKTDNLTVVHRYPMIRYARAFDLAVAAAGYNTFTELVHHGVPSVFVPNAETLADDQVGRAQRAADAGAALVAPYEDDEAILRTVREALADAGLRAELSNAAIELIPENGAKRAGEIVSEVCRSMIEADHAAPTIDVRTAQAMRLKKRVDHLRSNASRATHVLVDVASGARSGLPPAGRLTLLFAFVALFRRSTGRARAIASGLASRYPDAPGPLMLLVRIALRQREFADAEAHARRVIELAPDEMVGHRGLILALEKKGDVEGAMAAIDQAMRIRPVEALATQRLRLARLAHTIRAGAALREGRIEDGLQHIEQGLRATPRDPETHATRAALLRRKGDLSGAIVAARQAQKLSDDPRYQAQVDRYTGLQTALSREWLPDVARPERHLVPAAQNRVLHLLERTLPYWQSGYTVRTYYSLLAQRDAGLDPIAVTRLGFPAIDGIDAMDEVEDVGGIPHHRLPAKGARSLPTDRYLSLYTAKAAQVIEEVRPALIAPATSYHNAMVGLALGKHYDLPVVYEVRGFREDSFAENRDEAAGTELFEALHRTEQRLMLAADHVITLAEVMKDEIADRGVDRDRITVIPNAVDTERFAPRPKDLELARSLGLADRVVLGYISTLVGFEGVDLLLRAIHQLLQQDLPVGGLIVGEGPELASLRALADELGIADRVKLVGRVPHEQILDHYPLIDVFVVPRRNLRVCRLVTPLKPFEAMSMERAMLVSDVDALVEVVPPGERGLSFRAGDPEDLARQARVLVEDEPLRRKLGEQARTWVKRERTWHSNGERYKELYERVLAEHAAPRR